MRHANHPRALSKVRRTDSTRESARRVARAPCPTGGVRRDEIVPYVWSPAATDAVSRETSVSRSRPINATRNRAAMTSVSTALGAPAGHSRVSTWEDASRCEEK